MNRFEFNFKLIYCSLYILDTFSLSYSRPDSTGIYAYLHDCIIFQNSAVLLRLFVNPLLFTKCRSLCLLAVDASVNRLQCFHLTDFQDLEKYLNMSAVPLVYIRNVFDKKETFFLATNLTRRDS